MNIDNSEMEIVLLKRPLKKKVRKKLKIYNNTSFVI